MTVLTGGEPRARDRRFTYGRARTGEEAVVITRMWRGWTTPDKADDYARFLIDGLFPSMRGIPGFDGATLLRRTEGSEVGFVTLTRFESLEAVRAFAGEQYEVPVLEPEALALLSHYDERASHYETTVF
jgi:antibiotic biosynthesis monooxygenase (ABM) superfamily enzyme